MKSIDATIRNEVIDYLKGRISTNELIRKNDEWIEVLTEKMVVDSEEYAKAWGMASTIEGLLIDRVYQYNDDPALHRALREIVSYPGHKSSKGRLLGLHPATTHPVVEVLLSTTSLVPDVEWHSGEKTVVQQDIEPDRSFRFSRNANRENHRVTEPWAVKT